MAAIDRALDLSARRELFNRWPENEDPAGRDWVGCRQPWREPEPDEKSLPQRTENFLALMRDTRKALISAHSKVNDSTSVELVDTATTAALDPASLGSTVAPSSEAEGAQFLGHTELVGGNRSEGWEALQVQARAAVHTGAFVYTHRTLDRLGVDSVKKYMQSECNARFVDLSAVSPWPQLSLAFAQAFKEGLWTVRSLILDGNDLGSDAEAWHAWCDAIREHPGLQHLSLRHTNLDDAGAEMLAKALHRHAVLFTIDLGLNRIGDEGVTALADSVGDSHVIMEVNVAGCDASEECCAGLHAVLEQNLERFRSTHGREPRTLHELRKARAEAAGTAVSQPLAADALGLTQGFPDIGSGEVAASTLPPGCEVSTCRRNDTFFAKQPDPSFEADVKAGGADVVFFDASDEPSNGIVAELLARIDAGWRYTAIDREELIELRYRIDDMKAHRRMERDRAEEVLSRVTDLRAAWAAKLQPLAERALELKEALAIEVEESKTALQKQIQVKMQLKGEQEELEEEVEDSGHTRLTAQKLDSGLKMRHREVVEQIEDAQQRLDDVEKETERLEKDTI
eukprot:TRINITY_DN40768_c0_g1_i2.p1 TRINITY_DN40768_c0_g1~~TRINITY_DN40768_c0_g1_i2.p1  ORF type:complete len:570 (-),score=102.80 TRINITY_DN40768_c0_g1_i2:42-1751(-)